MLRFPCIKLQVRKHLQESKNILTGTDTSSTDDDWKLLVPPAQKAARSRLAIRQAMLNQ